MSRHHIHYWKCDRTAAFAHGSERPMPDATTLAELRDVLRRHLGLPTLDLLPGPGEGNHLTFLVRADGMDGFLRVEASATGDDHLAVESTVLAAVSQCGVRTPRVLGCDASRRDIGLAWQLLERIHSPNLNHWAQAGRLNLPAVAAQIGEAIARWQTLRWPGFGILEAGGLGGHKAYRDHFFLRLDEHLHALSQSGLMDGSTKKELLSTLHQHSALLDLNQGCLVHKDLALWNILGSADCAEVFIDFDDAMMGDAMDDFSLLACFHDAATLRHALDAAQHLRPHPPEAMRRFWMHLLRNAVIKTVIRLGCGYFSGSAPAFLGGRNAAAALRAKSLRLLRLATSGLRDDLPLSHLDSP